MNLPLLLDTLLIWSAQIFVLVTVAACAAITITHPKARLLFWQGILLLAVLIPVIEPWTPTPVYVPAVSVDSTLLVPNPPASAAADSNHQWRREDWLLLIVAGMALRLLWIAGGFLRLRAYRKEARVLAAPPLPFVSGAAQWYASDNVPGPVTYGWLRPSILLPSRVLALPAELREPIACHELVHVNRRDWLFVLGEELVRSALWFHPAVWLVLSRIQLAREQVVDREVVRLTENRESYLDALVAVAEQGLSDLAPAPLFLRKRQLAVRVAEVLKEVSMSRSKIAANLAGVFSMTLMAALVAMWFFPFVSPAQTAADDSGITVNPGAPVIHRAPVRRPVGETMTGTVIVEATLSSKGEVTDAHVLSGPAELRRSAIESVLQWHYSPGPGQAQASINFQSGPTEAPIMRSGVIGGVAGDVPGGRGGAVAVGGVGNGKSAGPVAASVPASTAGPISAFPATVKSIGFDGIGPESEQQLRSRIPVREGGTITQADLQPLTQAVQDFDSHLRVAFLFTGSDANGRTMGLNVGANPTGREILLPPAFNTGGRPELSIRVQAQSAQGQFIPVQGGANPVIRADTQERDLKFVKKTIPEYPALAKSARIQGVVNFAAVINPDGTVSKLDLINGHPLLVPAARDAVMQWVYAPSAAPVQTDVSVSFTLQ